MNDTRDQLEPALSPTRGRGTDREVRNGAHREVHQGRHAPDDSAQKPGGDPSGHCIDRVVTIYIEPTDRRPATLTRTSHDDRRRIRYANRADALAATSHVCTDAAPNPGTDAGGQCIDRVVTILIERTHGCADTLPRVTRDGRRRIRHATPVSPRRLRRQAR